jgi:hypothetical protein
MLLGLVGTSPNPGAVSHVHIEIRSFGASITDNTVLVKIADGSNNPYGILALGGEQAFNIYEVAQFFFTSASAFISDESSTNFVGITGLGMNITDGNMVTFETTSPPSPCPPSTEPQREYCSGIVGTDVQQTANGYRGFILAQQNVVVPGVEPSQVTTIP